MRALLANSLLAIAVVSATGLPGMVMADPKLTGRLHLDAAFYDDDKTTLDNGVLVRRARLGVNGNFGDGFGYHFEYNFAENSLGAADQFLSYSRLGPGLLKIGHFKVPFGLNEQTSSNSISFIERTMGTEAFVDARKLGVGYEQFADNWGYQFMAYTRGVGDDNASGDEPVGLAARFVFNPLTGDGGTVHLGTAIAYQSTDDDNEVRFRARPEVRAGGTPRLVDTGAIENVSSTLKLGLEAAWASGPFWVEGEYIYADVSRKGGFSDADFSAWHLQTGYVFNGTRPYRGGRFRTVRQNSDRAAWELAARYSTIDLNDGAISGGKQGNVTLGLNVYPSDNVRFMANVIFVDQKDTADKPLALALRTQVNF
ncbi:MAG: porin [Chromatiales bacterium]|nr:porin [Chromatiales bacterium]